MPRLFAGGSRSLSRVLARGLCLLVLPLALVATSQGVASADVVARGVTASATVRYQHGIGAVRTPGSWIDCNVSGYTRTHDTGLNSVRASIRCRTGWSWPGADAVQLTAQGAGEGCELSAYLPIVLDANADTTLTKTLSPTTAVPAGCILNTGDLDVYRVGVFGEDEALLVASRTFGWALGEFPLAPPEIDDSYSGTCPMFTISAKPRMLLTQYAPYPAGYTGRSGLNSYHFTVRHPTVSWITGSPNASAVINVVPVIRKVDGTYSILPTSSVSPNPNTGDRKVYRPNTTAPDWDSWNPPSSTTTGWTFVGVQVYADRDTSAGSYPTGDAFTSSVPTGTAGPDLGVTDPGKCRFWFGEKIAEVTADTSDEPAGPINNAPAGTGAPMDPEPAELPNDSPTGNTDASEAGCDGFSFTDPASWAGAGICVLVKLMQGLLEGIGKLLEGILAIPGAIVEAIGDLMAGIIDAIGALFLPSDGFMEGKLNEVKNAFSDSTVGNYSAAFTDMEIATPTAGCAGPQVDFEIKGVEQHWEPLNACSGGVATLAGLSKLFLTVMLSFFGGLTCLRAVGSGFGWRPGVAEAG